MKRLAEGWRRRLERRLLRRPTLMERLAGPQGDLAAGDLAADDMMAVLFHDAPAGMLVVDRAGRIVRANAAMQRMVGRLVDLSPGQPAAAVFPPAERDEAWAQLRPALDGRRPPRVFVARLDGAEADADHSAEIAAVALREADGAVSGLVLRIADVTAQKRLETQLSHGQKLQAVGQLAGGIAHDFNNLLTAMLGAADLALDRPEVDGQTREDLHQIRAGAERGAALVRQLLAFGRQQTLQPQVVAINDAIQDLSGMLKRLLGGRIRLELDLEAPGRLVRVDPTQLDQVLVNLAVNARDAMADGGTLTLRSGHITLFRALSRGQETIPPGRYVMIEVQDTGLGIPADILPRIFDPFFTTRRERGGNGLGLSTVHGIVRQSDGFLAVDSRVGEGTRVRVYLPRHDGREAVAIPRSPQDAPPAVAPPRDGASGQRTVLLVDDEDAVRRLAERALTQRGWRVLAADSAEAALELVGGAITGSGPGPALLISDVVMPGMDGPALVRTLRRTWPDLPAILVSGYAEETLRREPGGAAITWLPKPYTLKALAELAEQVAAGEFRPRKAGSVP